MRLGRPKSLSGLLLIGFTLVIILPLGAAVKATVQMRRVTQQSEALVLHGVETTRHTQELFQRATALERTARLYQVLGDPNLREVFARHRADFERSLAALAAIKPDEQARGLIVRLRADVARLAGAVDLPLEGDGTANLAAAIEAFTPVHDTVAALAEHTRTDIDVALSAVQVRAAATQRDLLWQAAGLVPVVTLIVLVFVSLLARPLRQIDQANGELGRGTFSTPVVVHGPSDLERLGRQLEWLRTRLLELAHEKNRFLRHMSHELKTPLANIREGTELLMEGAVGPLDQNQREVASILRENGIRLQRLIENLLSFSAWQARAVGLELSQFPLRQLVRSVLETQQLTLVAHRIHLDVKVQDVEVTADRGKLRLILDNLLSNSVKFTPHGGTIFVHGLTFKEQLILDVADTGPGIAREERAQVFDPFYTGKGQPGGPLKGTGIGLSVVLEFVQAHGGTIEMVDGVHPGAHFRIRLPIRSAEAATPSVADVAA